MKVLFAPWRMKYIKKEKEACFFCRIVKENEDEKNLILYRGKTSFIILNTYPYQNGHLMIAPYKHIDRFEKLEEREIKNIFVLMKIALNSLKNALDPEGFNLGMNIGRAAGAGVVDHLHIHIVPRWEGDTNFMPIFSDVKIIPQALEKTYKELKSYL